MTTKAHALGRVLDIGLGVPVSNLNAGASTGKNCSLQNCEGVLVLVQKLASGTTDDLAIDLQEVNGASGTPRDLDIITDYWMKSETALDNDEAWVKTTQSAASEIGPIAGTAEVQCMLVFEVRADQLSDGYTHIAVNVPDLGSTDTGYGVVNYIPFGLKVQRSPENLPSLLAPGVANA
jgi:hypothetical protein